MEYLGLALGIIVGLLLGLLGGGGSIMAVPIFVYVLGIEAKLAIATSLVVVGATSLVGTIPHFRAGNVDLPRAFLFVIGSFAGAYLGAQLSRLMAGSTQLLLFALVMLTASFFMMRGRRDESQTIEKERTWQSITLIIIQGIGVGIVTGLVGVGGGFMIVPALVLLGGIPMKRAVGTSLLVIAINSASAFIGYLVQPEIRQRIAAAHVGAFALIPYLGIFMLITFGGVFIGSALNRRVDHKALRRWFAIFLLVMAAFILVQNIDKLRGG
jgi:uncharacterized membrane protein YfcA